MSFLILVPLKVELCGGVCFREKVKKSQIGGVCKVEFQKSIFFNIGANVIRCLKIDFKPSNTFCNVCTARTGE